VTEVAGVEATVNLLESCSLGSATASCSASISVSAQGTSTALSTTSVLSGSDYHHFDVAITGGAEKTAQATATCAKNPGSAAAPMLGRSAAAYGLLGALAAAGVVML